MKDNLKNNATTSVSSALRGSRRVLTGTVISDKMDKTVVVEVSRRVLDEKFGKYLIKKTKYKAHSELNEAKMGDKITIIETKPISKEKRWKVQRVIEQNRRTQENSY